jgi:putative drug exporter of the RND superfamily
MGVVVAAGVLLDTFVVRSLLIPALAVHVGRATWWPGRPASAGHGGPHSRDQSVPQVVRATSGTP